MKFLALAFLLAAGCQSLLVQADAPSHYEQIRAVVVTYLTQAKESAQEFVANLDDDEFKDLKPRLTQNLDNIEAFIKSASESLVSVHEGLRPQIVVLSNFLNATSCDLWKLLKTFLPVTP